MLTTVTIGGKFRSGRGADRTGRHELLTVRFHGSSRLICMTVTLPTAASPARLILLLAVAFHIWRGEPLVLQLIVAVIAAVVAFGRGEHAT